MPRLQSNQMPSQMQAGGFKQQQLQFPTAANAANVATRSFQQQIISQAQDPSQGPRPVQNLQQASVAQQPAANSTTTTRA